MARKNKVVETESACVIKFVPRNEKQRKIMDTIKTHDVTFIYGPAGAGKALTLDSKVYTPLGPVLMRDIQLGDHISTPDGKTSQVIGVYPQGELDIYRVNFADGDYVECCGEHLWKVDNKTNAWQEKIVTTNWIRNNLKSPSGRRLLSIKTPTFVKFAKIKVDIDPYLLGVLLGDGSITEPTPILSTADGEILELATSVINKTYGFYKQPSHKYEYSLKRNKKQNDENDYTVFLKKYSLHGKNCYNKFIPHEYKYNTTEIRLSIIQGLMDTDGYFNKRNGLPEISLSSKTLAYDFKEIIESLGGICVVNPRKTSYTYKDVKKEGQISWRCSIRFNEAKSLFRLSRKKNGVKNRSKYPVKRIIDSVIPVGKKEAQCILIDNNDHLFLTDNFIITHNTHVPVVYALQQLLKGTTKRIVFTRPCVEAYGENLGFLPGDFNDKIAPYMIAIFDILTKLMDRKTVQALIDEGSIQTIPLAFQRGITFNDTIVVADEFQNTIPQQVRMFLTRMGENCKMIITGDVSQNDIHGRNGLEDAIERFADIPEIALIETVHADIVRNPLIEKIDKKYLEILPSEREGKA